MATTKCGQLRHIFDSENLSLHLKLRLYRAAVCSTLIYGCESWILTDKTMRSINNINSLLLSRITGNTPQQEARPTTTSHNLIRQIRIIRYKYLGKILRLDSTRLLHRALAQTHQLGLKGSLLMDAPQHNSFQDLREQAMDKATWNSRIRGFQ